MPERVRPIAQIVQDQDGLTRIEFFVYGTGAALLAALVAGGLGGGGNATVASIPTPEARPLYPSGVFIIGEELERAVKRGLKVPEENYLGEMPPDMLAMRISQDADKANPEGISGIALYNLNQSLFMPPDRLAESADPDRDIRTLFRLLIPGSYWPGEEKDPSGRPVKHTFVLGFNTYNKQADAYMSGTNQGVPEALSKAKSEREKVLSALATKVEEMWPAGLKQSELSEIELSAKGALTKLANKIESSPFEVQALGDFVSTKRAVSLPLVGKVELQPDYERFKLLRYLDSYTFVKLWKGFAPVKKGGSTKDIRAELTDQGFFNDPSSFPFAMALFHEKGALTLDQKTLIIKRLKDKLRAAQLICSLSLGERHELLEKLEVNELANITGEILPAEEIKNLTDEEKDNPALATISRDKISLVAKQWVQDLVAYTINDDSNAKKRKLLKTLAILGTEGKILIFSNPFQNLEVQKAQLRLFWSYANEGYQRMPETDSNKTKYAKAIKDSYQLAITSLTNPETEEAKRVLADTDYNGLGRATMALPACLGKKVDQSSGLLDRHPDIFDRDKELLANGLKELPSFDLSSIQNFVASFQKWWQEFTTHQIGQDREKANRFLKVLNMQDPQTVASVIARWFDAPRARPETRLEDNALVSTLIKILYARTLMYNRDEFMVWDGNNNIFEGIGHFLRSLPENYTKGVGTGGRLVDYFRQILTNYPLLGGALLHNCLTQREVDILARQLEPMELRRAMMDMINWVLIYSTYYSGFLSGLGVGVIHYMAGIYRLLEKDEELGATFLSNKELYPDNALPALFQQLAGRERKMAEDPNGLIASKLPPLKAPMQTLGLETRKPYEPIASYFRKEMSDHQSTGPIYLERLPNDAGFQAIDTETLEPVTEPSDKPFSPWNLAKQGYQNLNDLLNFQLVGVTPESVLIRVTAKKDNSPATAAFYFQKPKGAEKIIENIAKGLPLRLWHKMDMGILYSKMSFGDLMTGGFFDHQIKPDGTGRRLPVGPLFAGQIWVAEGRQYQSANILYKAVRLLDHDSRDGKWGKGDWVMYLSQNSNQPFTKYLSEAFRNMDLYEQFFPTPKEILVLMLITGVAVGLRTGVLQRYFQRTLEGLILAIRNRFAEMPGQIGTAAVVYQRYIDPDRGTVAPIPFPPLPPATGIST